MGFLKMLLCGSVVVWFGDRNGADSYYWHGYGMLLVSMDTRKHLRFSHPPCSFRLKKSTVGGANLGATYRPPPNGPGPH